MKELSIEEKAKRYDELKVTAQGLEHDGCFDKITLFDLFPELKESEDEKIRKELIDYINSKKEDNPNSINDYDTWLAWLEKQGQDGKVWFYREDYVRDKKQAYQDGIDNVLNNPQKYGLEKQGEQKPAWSEEDRIHLGNCIALIQRLSEDEANWLKNLKDRVQPQPKQEWKQENTDDLTDFENTMMHIGRSFFGQYAGLDPNDTNVIKEQADILLGLVPKQEWSEEDEKILKEIISDVKFEGYNNDMQANSYKKINWLKSLRPQKQWNPSEEMLEALNRVIPEDVMEKSEDEILLDKLYQGLKYGRVISNN